jgi:hypothetical protein
MVKLLDYGADWPTLEGNDNPFATVVMAHLKALETRTDDPSRYRWKLALVKRLYERRYSRQDILELFRFIDWVMTTQALLDITGDKLLELDTGQRSPGFRLPEQIIGKINRGSHKYIGSVNFPVMRT